MNTPIKEKNHKIVGLSVKYLIKFKKNLFPA